MRLGTAGKGKENACMNVKDDGYVQGLGDWDGYSGNRAFSQINQRKYSLGSSSLLTEAGPPMRPTC